MTWNSPLSLCESLESWKISGLLDLSNDINCLIQYSEKKNEEVNVCKEYNINYIVLNDNIGISSGIKKLVEISKNKYFLFLECDWRNIKNNDITKNMINTIIKELDDDNFDVCRLRNLKYPGHPIHYSIHAKNPSLDSELYLCTHYLNKPHEKYEKYIELYSLS